MKKPLPTVKADEERTQDSDEANHDPDVGKVENQVVEAVESNDESEKRLEPPLITSLAQRRRYRMPEGFVPRRSERIRDRNKNVDILNQGRL